MFTYHTITPTTFYPHVGDDMVDSGCCGMDLGFTPLATLHSVGVSTGRQPASQMLLIRLHFAPHLPLILSLRAIGRRSLIAHTSPYKDGVTVVFIGRI